MSDNPAKVVPLIKGEGVVGNKKSIYSAPLASVIDAARQHLMRMLQTMLDRADDALFELADRASSNATQNLYFESMREVRIRRRGLEQDFLAKIDTYLNTLQAGRSIELSKNTSLDELSDENLGLVDNEELEELVAVDGMVNKASHEFETQLMHFSIRLDSLFDRNEINETNNPFGPKLVCQAFAAISSDLEIDIAAKLVVFKLLDRYVVSELGGLYDLCNRLLIDQGVMPRLRRKQLSNSAANRTPGINAAGRNGQENPAQSEFFDDLCNMLSATQVEGSSSRSLVPNGQAPQISMSLMGELLASIQTQQLQNIAMLPEQFNQDYQPQLIDVRNGLDVQLCKRQPDRQFSLANPDDSAINLVTMLFQAILDDTTMTPPLKALLLSLQLPILRTAIADPRFFEHKSHPARRLLNDMAEAGLGWTPTENCETDPFYQKAHTVITYVLENFEGDLDVFQNAATDFAHFIEMDKRRVDLVEKRTIDAEDGRARSELAREKCERLIAEKTQGLAVPGIVSKILSEVWVNVLFLIRLQKGQDCDEWQQAIVVVDDLLWSISDSIEVSRVDRMRRIAPLLTSLREGMDMIGVSPADADSLFLGLEAVHKKCLVAKSSETGAGQPLTHEQSYDAGGAAEQPIGDHSLKDLDAELDDQLGTVDSVDVDSADTNSGVRTAGDEAVSLDDVDRVEDTVAVTDETRRVVAKLSVGNWFEFVPDSGDEDKKFRCRLVAVIRATNKYIFVNRAGMKVAERSQSELEQDIQTGKISTIQEGLIFDRALESVISNLRDSSSKSA